MNTAALRPVFAQGLIALGVCCGVSLILNAPGQEQLSTARAELAQVKASLHTPTPGALDTPATIEAMEHRLANIDALNTLARDQTEMFARYMALADTCGVRIDQLRPAQGPERAMTSTPDEITAGAIAKDLSTRCTVIATGPYTGVARFLKSIGDLGHASVRSARLAYMQDAGLEGVQATIEVVHFTFETRYTPPAVPTNTQSTRAETIAGVPGDRP